MPSLFFGILLIGVAVYCAVLAARKELYDSAPRQLTRVGFGGMSVALVLLGLSLFVFPEDAFRTEPTLLQRLRPFLLGGGVLGFFLSLILLRQSKGTRAARGKKAPPRAVGPGRWWARSGLWVCLGFGVLTVVIGWLGESERRFHEALLSHGRTTLATLEQVKKESGERGTSSTVVLYSYVDASGQRHQRTSGRPAAFEGRAPVPGDTFEVTYLPEAPERHVSFRMTAEKRDAASDEARTVLVVMIIALLELCVISWLDPDAGRFLWFPALAVLLVSWLGLLLLTGLMVPFVFQKWRPGGTWSWLPGRKPRNR